MRTCARGRRPASCLFVLALTAFSGSALAAPPLKHATAVEVRAGAAPKAAEVVVTFSEAPTYTARLEKKTRRLVVDVSGADVTSAPAALTERVGVVGGVMTQAFWTAAGKVTRILVTLTEDSKYAVDVAGQKLVIRLRPGEPGLDDPP